MMTVLDKIAAAAARDPKRTAYAVRGQPVTYGDLWDTACRRAELLQRQGTGPVIVYGHKEIGMVCTMLACLIAGRAYVPVERTVPPKRFQSVLRQSGAGLIVAMGDRPAADIACVSPEELEQFSALPLRKQENHTAYIIFTSGSTGEPKGVPISRDNLDNFANWIGSLQPLCGYRQITVFNQANFSFDLSVADLYYALCNGHTLLAFDGDLQSDYESVFDLLRKSEFAVMTPTFIRSCLMNPEFRRENYSRLRCIYFCGETLEKATAAKLLNAFPDLSVLNAYGPTEATSAVSAMEITREILETEPLLPVGNMQSIATGVAIRDGEIILKGRSVFHGYLGGIPGGYFEENGISCYATGDCGSIRDGKLFCHGRLDSQVKYKGYRIELNDIEENILQIPGVAACAVIAKKTEEGLTKMLKAFVVLENITAEEVRRELAHRVPSYMIPKRIVQLEQLPVTPNGKIDRKELQKR